MPACTPDLCRRHPGIGAVPPGDEHASRRCGINQIAIELSLNRHIL
jgi:hypothetical protein